MSEAESRAALEREAFEAAMARLGYHINPGRYADGSYRETGYSAGWEAWQARAALAAPAEPVAQPERNNPMSALAIRLLVAAGHITQEKADQAFHIACYATQEEAKRMGEELPWVAIPKPAEGEPVAQGKGAEAVADEERFFPHEFEVWQDDMMQAGVSGDRETALREALHYAAQYAQDGPVRVFEVVRRLVPLEPHP